MLYDVTFALRVGEACYHFAWYSEEFLCGVFSLTDPNLFKNHSEVALIIRTQQH